LSFFYLKFSVKDHQRFRIALKEESVEKRNNGFAAHPIFTYVSIRPESNNLGFFSPFDYPYVKKPGDYVIGIFGGSVAENLAIFANNNAFFRDAVKSTVKKLKNKNLIFLNFGAACAKQPMQFDRFAYFSDGIDFAINLDGFNEVTFNTPSAGAAYPCMIDLYLKDKASSSYLLAQDLLVNLISRAKARLVWSRIFDYSYTLVLAAHTLVVAENKLDVYFSRKLWELKTANNPKIFPLLSDNKQKDFFVLGADNWAKYTSLQSGVAQVMKVPSLFILQPNINFIGSKPLSPEEKSFPMQTMANGGSWKDFDVQVTRGYSQLRSHLHVLKNRNPHNFLDLTEAFKTEAGTIYTDQCCHYNDYGYKVIIPKIAAAMVPLIN